MAPTPEYPAGVAAVLTRPVDQETLSRIGGNASHEHKEMAIKWYSILGLSGKGSYGWAIRQRLEVKELSVEPSVDDPAYPLVKLVGELEVEPDMCDAGGMLDQGCMGFLMDEGSAIALLTSRVMQGGLNVIGVSQTFNFYFHSPIAAGARIRIVNRSVATEKDIGCCRSEIWDIANHRLVVSGTQLQMLGSIKPNASSIARM
ncbi:hypothetical protein B0H34DRAFT_690755 [Crassisporium funariophilum]|nr:hypothetical protein B0H34DRAFT_690755 [Crassisporium funariophilum]